MKLQTQTANGEAFFSEHDFFSHPVKLGFWKRLKHDLKTNCGLYILCLPAILFIIVFCYCPMVGIAMGFEDYKLSLGIFGSPWNNFQNFIDFFTDPKCGQLILNTLCVSGLSLLLGFPLPVIISLILNSLRSRFKEVFRVVSFIPNFLSVVVVVAMMNQMLKLNGGVINQMISYLGGEKVGFMTDPNWFIWVFVLSGIWQGAGWGTIIYTSALSSVDPQLYEAAKMDGANKFQIIRYIDFPEIKPTVIISLILGLGGILSVGFDKIVLIQTAVKEDAEYMNASNVISSYIYNKMTGTTDTGYTYGYTTAVGLFNSVINFAFFAFVNFVAKKTSGYSIW